MSKVTPDYLTTSEAAELLGLTSKIVTRLFDQGYLQGFTIPGSRHRRLSRESVLAAVPMFGLPGRKVEGPGP